MLIRRDDFGDLKKLTIGSRKEVWYTCEKCGYGFLVSYNNYNKKNNKNLCKYCSYQREEYKRKSSEKTKNLWKDENYRKLVSENVSKGAKGIKKSIKPKKEPYYHKLKSLMEEENYGLLTTLDEYIKGSAEVECKCPNNHIFKVTYKKWAKQNTRCLECVKEDRYKRINDICTIKNFKFLKLENKNGRSYIEFECENGHVNNILLCNFYKEINCAVCSDSERRSEPEKEICEFLTKIGINHEFSNRKLISPYEVDIYVPQYNIAIEYNGSYSHDEDQKSKEYHLTKTNKCKDKGVQLIHIFDHEWILEKQKTKNRIKQLFGIYEKKFYARNCIVREIDTKTARYFCEKYHIQGYGQSKIKLGLYNGEFLVSIMTFSKPNISKGSKNKDIDVWELNRYCSKYNIIGGASKLLEYFKNNYKWKEIYTFADRRWSDGGFYKKIGFEFVKYTEPNYWYWNKKKRDIEKYHRFKFRKDRIKDWGGGNTEVEVMHYHGWRRIWDCGNIKYIIENK